MFARSSKAASRYTLPRISKIKIIPPQFAAGFIFVKDFFFFNKERRKALVPHEANFASVNAEGNRTLTAEKSGAFAPLF